MQQQEMSTSCESGETKQCNPEGDTLSIPLTSLPYADELSLLSQIEQQDHASITTPNQPVIMTNRQLVFLLQSLRSTSEPKEPPPKIVTTNLANCTSRFNGVSDVMAFLDAVKSYKESLGVHDDTALRDLPMLLTDIAATWWQGVKTSISSWQEAVHLLQQTYGSCPPPHSVYRQIFSQEQGEECTDVFVSRVRAIIAELPYTLPENPVQLDMVYGLLHRRICDRVARSGFKSFAELLQQARVVENALEEVSMAAKKNHFTSIPLITSSSASAVTDSVETSQSNGGAVKKITFKIDSCQVERSSDIMPYSDSCCGNRNLSSNSIISRFLQSVSDPNTSYNGQRSVRPMLNIKVFGVAGIALIHTGIQHSIASESFAKHFRSNNQMFIEEEISLKFGDGSSRLQIMETALVDVEVQGVRIQTLFVVFPGALESMLGMNFIQDAGLTLNFDRQQFALRSTGFYDLKYKDIHSQSLNNEFSRLRFTR